MKHINLHTGNYEGSVLQEITEDAGTKTGIQTLLILTSNNHMSLSAMADKKANILISMNAIIISVILTAVLPDLQEMHFYTIPILIFLAGSITTIIFAIIAIRPTLNKGIFNLQDIQSKKVNLLFFGNFYKMPFIKYMPAMKMMMRDTDHLYVSILKDIYFLGGAVAKKFRLLRLAYNIFMAGLILSTVAFCIASL